MITNAPVYLVNPKTNVSTYFQPGAELPEWAQNLIGNPDITQADQPEVVDNDSVETNVALTVVEDIPEEISEDDKEVEAEKKVTRRRRKPQID